MIFNPRRDANDLNPGGETMKRTGKRFLGPVTDVEGRSRGSLGGMKPAGKGVKDQTMLSRGLHVEMLEPRLLLLVLEFLLT